MARFLAERELCIHGNGNIDPVLSCALGPQIPQISHRALFPVGHSPGTRVPAHEMRYGRTV